MDTKTIQITNRPSHTQIPNWIIDQMDLFTSRELKIMLFLCRKTIGWHKDTQLCSLSYVMSGIHSKDRTAVSKDIKNLLHKKYIRRVKSGNSYRYSLSASIEINTSLLVLKSIPNKINNNKINKDINIINSNNINTGRINSSVPVYGNKEINEIISYFKEILELSVLDGTDKQNRRYANLAIKKFKGIDNVKLIVDCAKQSVFWQNKLTSFSKLYYNGVQIVSENKVVKNKSIDNFIQSIS